jgi:23S rRNA (guanine745-N1)-methyltransferase
LCPVCRQPLEEEGGALSCEAGHAFDVAREGYVNLLLKRGSRAPGDSPEMVQARRRFLGTGLYDRFTDTLVHVVGRAALARHLMDPVGRVRILDVGCGEGHHTRRIAEAIGTGAPGLDAVPIDVLGIDVAKTAISIAARSHRRGAYAVASASEIPLETGSVDVALNVFGPVFPDELARVVRPGGVVVAAHPGPGHLGALRALVYADDRPHEVKDPLRASREWFARAGTVSVTFPITISDAATLTDLFTMTPYRWHADLDITERLSAEAARPGGFVTDVDIVISSSTRRFPPTL